MKTRSLKYNNADKNQIEQEGVPSRKHIIHMRLDFIEFLARLKHNGYCFLFRTYRYTLNSHSLHCYRSIFITVVVKVIQDRSAHRLSLGPTPAYQKQKLTRAVIITPG